MSFRPCAPIYEKNITNAMSSPTLTNAYNLFSLYVSRSRATTELVQSKNEFFFFHHFRWSSHKQLITFQASCLLKIIVIQRSWASFPRDGFLSQPLKQHIVPDTYQRCLINGTEITVTNSRLLFWAISFDNHTNILIVVTPKNIDCHRQTEFKKKKHSSQSKN